MEKKNETTALQPFSENHLANACYQAFNELSNAMIWEVDIPARTLYQSESVSKKFGHRGSVFPNAPESLIATGTISEETIPTLRQMYEALYAGRDEKTYCLQSLSETGEYVWVRSRFRVLRNEAGEPVRAIGIAENAPDVAEALEELRGEERFAASVASPTLRFVKINLTQGLVVKTSLPGITPPIALAEIYSMYFPLFHAEDAPRMAALLDLAEIRRRIQKQEQWLFVDYRLKQADNAWHWRNMAINLLKDPQEDEILAFCYFRDVDTRHHWAEFLPDLPERDNVTMLYTPESMARLANVAAAQMPEDTCCALTVFELNSYGRIRRQQGTAAAEALLATVGRLCRILVDGDAVVSQLSKTEFAVFRTDAGSPGAFHTKLMADMERVKGIAEQFFEIASETSCGYAVCTKENFKFEELLSHSRLACRIAHEQPELAAVMYSAPDEALLNNQTTKRSGEAKRRVLLADDDDISRAVVKMNLEQEYIVDEAEDGMRALELIRQREYALLLSDIQMPRMTGWDLLQALRAENRLLKTPVIMITADGGRASEVKALNLGASDVIVKPIVPEVLLSRARNIIGRQEAAAAMEQNALYELRF